MVEDALGFHQFPVAAALVHGTVGAEQLEEAALHDTRVTRLIDAMELRVDDAFSSLFPAERWARAHVTLHDGRTMVSEPARARGNPENPLEDTEMRAKYRALTQPVLGAPRSRRIEALVDEIDSAPGAMAALIDELLSPWHSEPSASDDGARAATSPRRP